MRRRLAFVLGAAVGVCIATNAWIRRRLDAIDTLYVPDEQLTSREWADRYDLDV